MNGVDYANRINRQSEIYRKNIADSNKAHDAEVERLEKTHEHRETQQKEAYDKQLTSMEKSHTKANDRIRDEQRKALADSGKKYEEALNKYKSDFHQERSDNIKNWNKKFGELKDNFNKNIQDTEATNKNLRNQLESNYTENVKNIRETADKDLQAYMATRSKDKKETDFKFRMEKADIIRQNQKERSALMQEEQAKRNFMQKNAIKDVNDGRELATKRYLETKDIQAKNFQKMNDDLNNKIQTQIIQREDDIIARQTEDNRKQNVAFSDRFQELSESYNKDMRNLEYRKRAEAISQGEVNKEIQKNYKENLEAQVDRQRQTQMRERFDVEEKYSKRLDDTISSYQNTLRESNISTGEKIAKIEANASEENRKQRYKNKIASEKAEHDHQVALRYVEDKNASKEADARKSTNKKVESLKENFNKSMKEAQIQSKKTFEITRDAMLEDKRRLEKRLHEQNSKQNAFIKEVYHDKMNKLSAGYEKRIQQLELQNELLQQNLNDSVRDIIRKTNFEIERQRKGAQESAENRVMGERAISKEKQDALNDKIKSLESNFTAKMNEQTLMHRKKVKDVQFQLTQKLNSEVNRYKDIIDQNNKFMAREFQRLKLASDTERQRLITQYEDRIQQLQRVHKEKADEIEQFNQLNQQA